MLKTSRFLPLIATDQRFFFGGGAESGENDVTTRTEPWSDAKPYFRDLYKEGKDAFLLTSRSPYPGPFFAKGNAWDAKTRNEIDEITEEQEVDIERLRDEQRKTLAGHYLDYTNNPYLAPTIDSALERAGKKVQEQLLPQLLDASIQAGAYAGPAHQLLADSVLANFAEEATRTVAQVAYENYVKERNYQENAAQVFGQIHNLEAASAKMIQANADLFRQLEQLGYDEALAIFKEQGEAPWRGLAEFSGLLTGGGFNNSTQDNPDPKKNILGSALQGAAGGAATGAPFGPPGMIIGGILGGVLGGFG